MAASSDEQTVGLDRPGIPADAEVARATRAKPATEETKYDRATLIASAVGFTEDLGEDFDVTPEMVAGAIRLAEVEQHQDALKTNRRATPQPIDSATRADVVKWLKRFHKRTLSETA